METQYAFFYGTLGNTLLERLYLGDVLILKSYLQLILGMAGVKKFQVNFVH